MSEKIRKRWQRRPGTTGGKLPWNDWRNTLTWRRATQILLLAINIYIGVTFYFWVRYFETGGDSVYLPRPGGIEGWLPIAGLMNIKYLWEMGRLPPIHVASMLLLVVFIITSLLVKKSFCSWLCPIGTFSELIAALGKKIFKRHFTLPTWLDIPLRGLKYLLLGFFLYIALSMPAQGIYMFLMSPYGLIADVKMLGFFRNIGNITLGVIIGFTVISLFVRHFWCRYLCPYGALLGLFSLLSPVKIRRDANSCIDCGKCAKACPSHIPVDKLIQVRTAECNACMTCVESCPVASTLSLSLLNAPRSAAKVEDAHRPLWQRTALSGAMMTLLILSILFATVGFAMLIGVWDSPIPEQMYFKLIPGSQSIGHP
ncbi:4Fe-4S binding protein [Candidatus Symbiopectobacterium sp. NZEC135]|uniref:4Fe-4S binding protein n=1 Tax=Candidatus Symbiopectobacterium sp. NZEC135 TaxID=2820471 RepID=UPI0022260B57|nr:4Fe-4S binding protein [Candidatus Symbiopectobacterium sp. NZEC135]MCW2480956.1 4Fe-4S binding protein [Candidatus Symbiopectobacterium sp. NZEC135]